MSQYPVSDHYDGKYFFNPGLNVDKTFIDVLKWNFFRQKGKWPLSVENTFKPQLAVNVKMNEACVTFINHVTYLVQLDNCNLLFDPVFCERASPFKFAGFKRVRRPGIEIEDLPKIDLVLISHNHYDHMDLESLKYLHEKFNPLFVMPLGNIAYFKTLKEKMNYVELDWWHEFIFNDVKITLTPAQHWSARGLFDRRKALWGGFVVENQNQNKIYFMGDSGFSEKMFSDIQKKFNFLDLAFIPIGAYEPRWFMKLIHLNPQEAVKSHLLLNARKSIGMHFGTFNLTDESWDQPLIDLNKELKEQQVINFEVLSEGQTKNYTFE